MRETHTSKPPDEPREEGALWEGERLLEEFEQAKACGELPSFTKELDEKCRSLIRSTFAAQSHNNSRYTVRKITRQAAAIVLVLFCVSSILVASVEAIRAPVFRFLFGESEKYSIIMIENDAGVYSHPTAPLQSDERKKSPLIGFLPEGYELIHCSYLDTGGFCCYYRDKENHGVAFHALSSVDKYSYDTESAEVSQIKILEHSGVLVKKDGYRFIWSDDSTKIIYSLSVSNWDYEKAWDLVETIAQCPDWITMIYGGY